MEKKKNVLNENKVLVNENQIQINSILDNVLTAAETINTRLIPALQSIGKEINNEVMKDSLSGANEIRKEYFKTVQSDLKLTKTKSIRNLMEEAATEQWENFERDLLSIRRDTRQYKFLTIENGACILSKPNEEKLKDSYRLYITEPKEIEAYNLHNEIVQKLNQFFKENIGFRWYTLFPIDSTGKISRNDSADYSKFV